MSFALQELFMPLVYKPLAVLELMCRLGSWQATYLFQLRGSETIIVKMFLLFSIINNVILKNCILGSFS